MDDIAKFVAGNLALDFHNTVSWKGDIPFEANILESYSDVLNWAVRAGILDTSSAQDMAEWANAAPVAAAEGLSRIHGLRDVLHLVFDAAARGEAPSTQTLSQLNDWISCFPLRLRATDHSFTWEWTVFREDPSSVVWPVVWSAANLLRSDQLGRVGACEATGCGWLFVDQSRRHNRKWCEMETCGNRAKAQRHYRRKQLG